ncbi:MAG: ABC-F family ATP-binding cassette domain-containing protein [Elusimicrobia bacterium]|nr:ABC-F family ATP-binding cassette domain-containing protein [Elusimicrobiota bacterium]
MAVLLSCQGLSKTFGPRPLFENLSFGLNEGERTGLIGPNGGGKSTLLKILSGQESPDSGALSLKRGLRMGYLAQQDRFDEPDDDWTVRREVVRALQGLGWQDHEIDSRADAGLIAARFEDPGQCVVKLSGGERKRLAVLCQVAREPDLLLLDEPTNHLDVEGVRWLEGFLSSQRFSFLMVTHDRRFLERVTNRVMELNKRYSEGHLSSAGNYSRFLENREALFAVQESREASVANIVRGEIAWLRRGSKARSTKQQARIDRAGELMDELSELKYRNSLDKAAAIDFTASERRSKRLVEAKAVAKSMGGRLLFEGLDLRLGPGDKLGLLGANGSGKSTLLKVLAGRLAPDSGTVRMAEGLKAVTFDQHRESLDLDLSLHRALCPAGEHVFYRGSRVHVRGWASRFLFRQEQLDMPLSRLSGGEQSRVLIARLMLEPADLLLLDEPTNDLDLPSLEVLESSMQDFPGALVLVTHDRYLLDRVSRRILALDGLGGARFFAELSQWEDWRAGQDESASANKGQAGSSTERPTLTPKEWRELKNMEASIRAAEAQVESARSVLEDPSVASDAEELARRHEKLDEAQRKVDALFHRWTELDARHRPGD